MLTNYHISFHPLCEIEDAVHYTCYKICNYMMVKNVTKRKMLQKQKNTEKNVPKIEEDFGASNDSSIGSYDSWLLEKINLFSGWMWTWVLGLVFPHVVLSSSYYGLVEHSC